MLERMKNKEDTSKKADIASNQKIGYKLYFAEV
jgi:hypothetical protein